jgi:hypothetical protein
MFDIFDSISNGLMNAITKEFFSRLKHYIIENKEKIIAVVLYKKEPRDYYELSVNYPILHLLIMERICSSLIKRSKKEV